MNNSYFTTIGRAILLTAFCLILLFSTSYSQIGELGIYGSAPTPASTPFPCGPPRYARINHYPDYGEGDGLPSWSQTVPLNGLKNFNFYYTASGTGFLSGGPVLGGYIVTYLNSSQVNCYGSGDIVTYTPNSGYTNGVQVRPFNGSLTTPLGIHGTVLARIPGGGGVTAPLKNAIASVGPANSHKAITNGAGYFSIYYSLIYGADGGFLPSSAVYYTRISGEYDKCTYTWDDPLGSIYLIFGGPEEPIYYVFGADPDIGTITLESTSPGCQP